MSISVIIPHYPFNDQMNVLLKRCVSSFRADEKLIVVNQGIGFAKAVNQGLRVAMGDFLCVVNNDLYLAKGSLRDLCVENVVTSPIVNGSEQDFWGCWFCIPRSIFEKVGGLDEQFEVGYFEDLDYRQRLLKEGVELRCITSVRVDGQGGTTMKQFKQEEVFNTNKAKFEEKWKNATML